MQNYNAKPLVILVSEKKDQIDRISLFLQDKHDVLVFNDPEDILDVFNAYCLRVRAVLISLELKEFNGIDLLKELKQISILPEYIMLSQEEDISEAVESLKYGAVDYVAWPVDKDHLMKKIELSYQNKNYFKKLQSITSDSLLDKLNLNVSVVKNSSIAKDHWENGKIISLSELIENVSDTKHKKLLNLIEEKLQEQRDINSKKTILIVEDDPLFSDDLYDLLSPYFELVTCDTGQKVRDFLKSQHDPIDVVLLDIYLPDATGIELLADFNEHLPNSGIIIMTGFKEVDIAVSSLQKGANDYINKPFFKKDILTKIAMVLQHQYFLSIMPLIQEKLAFSPISFKTKVDILTEYCEIKRNKNDDILMSDIYMFFPEFKKLSIPDTIPVPNSILDDGVILFIEDLEDRLKQVNELVNK